MLQNLSITVSVNKTVLIEALKTNRDQHIKDYKVAKHQYFLDIQEELQKRLALAEKEDFQAAVYISLTQPVNNVDEYDRYVRMFEACEDDVIKISAAEYDCIVEDNWQWARNAALSNSSYISKASSRI